MRYLVLISLFLAIWAMLEAYVLTDRGSEGPTGFWNKIRDLGRRFHRVIGIIAVLLVAVYLLRLLWYAMRTF